MSRTRTAAALMGVATGIGLLAWAMQAALGRLVPGAPYETWGGVFRLVEAELWLVLVVIAYVTAHRWPVEGRHHWQRAASQLLVGLVLAFAFGGIIYALAPTLRPWWYDARGGEIVGSSAKDAVFGYALAAGLAYGVVRWRTQRARQLAALEERRRATAAQLSSLALDLRPDAVLRTMDALAALIPHDPSTANDGIVLLAASLTATMDAMRNDALTLDAEVTHARALVALHAITMGLRIDCVTTIDGVGSAIVPPRIVAGAVEAALAEVSAQPPGPITVSAAREDAHLVIAVEAPGQEPPAPVREWADRWADRQERAQARGGRADGAVSLAWAGGDRTWALQLRVPWRELSGVTARVASGTR